MLLQLRDSRFAKEYLNQLSSPSKYSAFVSFCYSYQYLQLWIQTPLCPALLKQMVSGICKSKRTDSG